MKGTAVESVLELIQSTNKSDEDESRSKKKIYFRQWVMWLNFLLVQILLGMAYGYSAISLQQLKAPKNDKSNDMKLENGEILGRPHLIVNSLDMQSWIASSMLLFMMPGCWILAACSNKLGRKPILLISVAGFTVSWIIIAFANNAYHIVVGRSLSGVCVGTVTGLTYMYLGECAIPKLRPIFYTLFTVSFTVGIELCHLVGTWYHWRTTALFSAGFGIITFLSNYHLPESPVWLIHKNKFKNAQESWLFLRGKTNDNEFQSMCSKVELKPRQQTINHSRIMKFHSSTFWKPLGILIMLFTTAQLSGMAAVSFYSTPIIAQIASSTNAYIPTLILDTFRLGGSIVLCFLAKRFSTRTLMLFSGLSCSLILFLLALSIYFNIWAPWIQLILLFVHDLTVVMGLGPLPWTFCSELFAVNHKEVGVSIITNYYCIISFIIVKSCPHMFSIFEPWRTFLIYSSFTLIGTIILYFILPNTKNKSLKEIELLFSQNSKS